jgi:hypothetical protein
MANLRKLVPRIEGRNVVAGATGGNVNRTERIRKTAADEYARHKPQPAAAPAQPLDPEERFVRGLSRLTSGADFRNKDPEKPSVYQVWYAPAQLSMFVTFFDNTGEAPQPGPTYRYWIVSEQEARMMFRASSKGVSVWDQFRVRGSATGHRKHYERV